MEKREGCLKHCSVNTFVIMDNWNLEDRQNLALSC